MALSCMRKFLTVCAYSPNCSSGYLTLQSLKGAIERVPSWDSVVLLGDLYTHVGNDEVISKKMIEGSCLLDLELFGVLVFDLCVHHV